MNPGENQVQSVVKAMRLLDILAAAHSPLPLQELSRRSGWPKSTVHGLLSAMRENGVIDQSPEDGRYRLGVHLIELGNLAQKYFDAVSISRPFLQSIAAQTGESAHLCVLDRGEALVLESAEISNPLRVVADKGTRFPLYSTALGKAILAYLPEHEFYQAVHAKPLTRFTPHTLTEPQALRDACAAILESGTAVEDGEYRIGLRAVAAPLFDIAGQVNYSIGVTGMFRRTSDEKFIHAQQLVLHAAGQISAQLGHQRAY